MKFKKIVIIDACGLTDPELLEVEQLSELPISIHFDYPSSDAEIINRIGDADCVLVSWHTKITEGILRASKQLKFVGMCCSLYDENSANVDIRAARELGIEVKGVRDYGDEGTLEFIFSQLVFLFQGLGQHKWRNEPTELKNKSIGIIGLGTLGLMVAKTAIHFGMHVYYYSRSRKFDLESLGISYLPLNELMQTCNIITTHLPKNTFLLNQEAFEKKKENSILINTSLGLTFEKEPFLKWLIRDPTSFAIFDGAAVGKYAGEFSNYKNIILTSHSSGFTVEAKKRLSQKVVQNMKNFLER